MRSMIWVSFVTAALLGGTACKKSETEKTGNEMKKAQENVDNKARDFVKAEDKAQNNVDKQERKLDVAQDELVKARTDYAAAVQTRLAKIDAKLGQIGAKTDMASKYLVDKLQARRAEL